MNPENATELFEACSHRSYEQLELLLAARFPSPMCATRFVACRLRALRGTWLLPIGSARNLDSPGARLPNAAAASERRLDVARAELAPPFAARLGRAAVFDRAQPSNAQPSNAQPSNAVNPLGTLASALAPTETDRS
ncbi:MAG TPA: hypothetical protein VHW01_15420 [Polyangiaceae bacterium]|nr:hypothetical protein [Polyangiaceae bacterium]